MREMGEAKLSMERFDPNCDQNLADTCSGSKKTGCPNSRRRQIWGMTHIRRLRATSDRSSQRLGQLSTLFSETSSSTSSCNQKFEPRHYIFQVDPMLVDGSTISQPISPSASSIYPTSSCSRRFRSIASHGMKSAFPGGWLLVR